MFHRGLHINTSQSVHSTQPVPTPVYIKRLNWSEMKSTAYVIKLYSLTLQCDTINSASFSLGGDGQARSQVFKKGEGPI